jgi:acetyltransferase-like isoleucine patch superfamily enzyme
MEGVTLANWPKPGAAHPRVTIEPPVQITKLVHWGLPTQIGAFSMLHGPGEVFHASIGRYCSIAPGVVIGSNEHAIDWLTSSSLAENPDLYGWSEMLGHSGLRARDFRGSVPKTEIGHDVWIGRGAFIRSGVRIGDGAVIGAYSVVVHDVPDFTVVAGNPARIIRYRFTPEVICSISRLQWWRYSIFDLDGIELGNVAAALGEVERRIATGAISEYKPVLITPDHIRGVLGGNGST